MTNKKIQVFITSRPHPEAQASFFLYFLLKLYHIFKPLLYLQLTHVKI